MISPKRRIRVVITRTSMIKPIIGKLLKSNSVEETYALKMTIPTFTKLFVINIVASNLLGISNKERINLLALDSLDRISFRCTGFSEKYAISEPEIIADKIKSKRMIIILIKTSIVKPPVKALLIRPVIER